MVLYFYEFFELKIEKIYRATLTSSSPKRFFVNGKSLARQGLTHSRLSVALSSLWALFFCVPELYANKDSQYRYRKHHLYV